MERELALANGIPAPWVAAGFTPGVGVGLAVFPEIIAAGQKGVFGGYERGVLFEKGSAALVEAGVVADSLLRHVELSGSGKENK